MRIKCLVVAYSKIAGFGKTFDAFTMAASNVYKCKFECEFPADNRLPRTSKSGKNFHHSFSQTTPSTRII